MSLATNLASIKTRITQAAQRSGRDPQSIKLVVAGKYANAGKLLQAIKAGVKIIGENRAQDLIKKHQVIRDRVNWHFIGHLQTNKVKQVVPIISLLHSLDSSHLADELEKQLRKINKILPVLVEVNFDEATKFGITPGKLPSLISYCRKLPHLKLVGLMTMNHSSHFRALRQLARKYRLPKLSMGTSQDFEVAIEEGATFIRLGRALLRA